MAARDPGDKVVADIKAGRLDGRLKDIAQAIFARTLDGKVQFRWRITLDGDTWDQDNVAATEVSLVERALGKSWLELDPRTSMDHFVAFVVAHLQEQGDSVEAAIARAEELTQADVVAALSEYEVVQPDIRVAAS